MKNIIGMFLFATGAYIMAWSMDWITDYDARLMIVDKFQEINAAIKDFKK